MGSEETDRSIEQRMRIFETVMASTEDFIYLFDLDGKFTYANRAILKLWQRDLDEVVGKDFSELGYPPELAERHERQIESVIDTKRAVRDANPFTSPAGETRYYEYIFTPVLDDQGEVEAVAGITRDVTERKEAMETLRKSEERLRRALGAAKMVAWEWDAENQELVTFPRRGESTGVPFERDSAEIDLEYGVLHPDDRQGHRAIQQEAIENADSYVSEYRIRNPDTEEWVWVEDSARAVVTGENKWRLIGVVRDITERKAAEEALREADRRKDRFLALLSHELRNPLAPIKLSLHLLDHAPAGSDDERRARETIERQTDQLIRLVDDLLDVTRVTRDKIELQCQRLELNELTRQTVEDHRSLAEASDIELEFEPAESAVFVDGDSNRLAQVVGNLLQNSAKFSEPGGIARVSVECDEETETAEVHVVDDGIGMSQETLDTLFEPFAQADVSLEHAGGGLGLGLALVRGLVELHGGEIDAQSAGIGQGAEFVVRLPAEFETRDEAVSPREEQDAESLEILIIEDNPDVATSLCMVLELKGHDVTVANDGTVGLEKVRAERPDVVICDIGLPEMDGFAVARSITSEAELDSICLIALSGYARPEDRKKSKAAGFDFHLAKPPDMKKLDEILAGLSVPT